MAYICEAATNSQEKKSGRQEDLLKEALHIQMSLRDEL